MTSPERMTQGSTGHVRTWSWLASLLLAALIVNGVMQDLTTTTAGATKMLASLLLAVAFQAVAAIIRRLRNT